MDNQDLEEKIKDHDKRIRELELNTLRLGDKLSNLCDKLDSLISVFKFGSTTLAGGILTLIVFIIEQHIH